MRSTRADLGRLAGLVAAGTPGEWLLSPGGDYLEENTVYVFDGAALPAPYFHDDEDAEQRADEWSTWDDDHLGPVVAQTGVHIDALSTAGADAELITALHNAAPGLLAELRLLREVAEEASNLRNDAGISFEDDRIEYREHQITRFIWSDFCAALDALEEGPAS